MFGICNLANIPLRIEPSDRSELISQVLFGEHFTVLEEVPRWTKVKLAFDDYEGWICNKQFKFISSQQFDQLSEDCIVLNSDLIEYITGANNVLIPIPLGASISFLNSLPVLVEAMNAVRLRRQEDFRAGGGIIFARGPHRHHAAGPCINVEESIGPQMFRK